jgi:predicted N-formylglutamate amidohydrolase
MASDIQAAGNNAGSSLLTDIDPPPVRLINPLGASSFLLIGDHAGRRIPAMLGTLGIGAGDATRHIAWDIGVATLGERLAARIDAVFVAQVYSRLVVDCNRGPGAHDAIPPVSDGTVIPGNEGLSDADRAARFAAIHEPYQRAIAAALDRRDAAEGGEQTVIVALHSFTPTMGSSARPWQIGILHDAGDTSFAARCLAWLRAQGDLTVGDNEPYRMDQIDYTIPRHAYPANRPYVEIEIRQDLLADDAGIDGWVDRLAAMLVGA